MTPIIAKRYCVSTRRMKIQITILQPAMSPARMTLSQLLALLDHGQDSQETDHAEDGGRNLSHTQDLRENKWRDRCERDETEV